MNTKKPNESQTEDFNWERRLENLRQTRQINAPYAHAPLVRESREPAAASASANQPAVRKLDDKSRDRVLREYLLKWQQEHNSALAQEPHEELETDAMVLLEENWLNAQSSLQMRVSEKYIESTRTVWLNPKRRTVGFPEQQEQQAEPEHSENHPAQALSDDPNEAADEKIIVNINVLNPQTVGRKEVFCLSEQELAERLIKRMRPHVTDAVNGMIRVALQKQMALLSYNLQQVLNEQAPELVEDVLEHNVKKVLTDLKYEMKYKREK